MGQYAASPLQLPPRTPAPSNPARISTAYYYSQHLVSIAASVKNEHDYPKINEPYPPHYVSLFSGVLGLPLGHYSCSSVHIYNPGFLLAA